MASLWEVPIIYVLELNHLAQSTEIKKITAGSIEERFKAFGIETFTLKSTHVGELIEFGTKIINSVRKDSRPRAVIVEADRLCAHSKSDDNRKKEEINFALDPINILKNNIKNYKVLELEAKNFIQELTL